MRLQKRIQKRRHRRKYRVRNRVRRSSRPRLCLFRSHRHMYAQIIDDNEGRTLVAASTVEKELGGAGTYAGNVEAATRVGKAIAERAIAQGIRQVALDRGPCKYHGRVAALAESARQAGLEF